MLLRNQCYDYLFIYLSIYNLVKWYGMMYMILGLKIINTNQLGKFDWDRTKADDAVVDVQSNLLVTCSMDRTLVATDMTSGKRVWQTELNTAPLCLDATPDGAYIGMGKQSRHLYVYTLIISQFVLFLSLLLLL